MNDISVGNYVINAESRSSCNPTVFYVKAIDGNRVKGEIAGELVHGAIKSTWASRHYSEVYLSLPTLKRVA